LHLHKNRKLSRAYKKYVVNQNIRPDFSFFHLEKVFIPVHDSSHWTMYVIYPRRKHLLFYDSLNLKEPANLLPQDILDYVEDECAAADLQYRPSQWKYYRAEVMQQGNGVDCGFCVIKHAVFVLHDLPLDLPVSCIANPL
jgi:Ulp1 family protease